MTENEYASYTHPMCENCKQLERNHQFPNDKCDNHRFFVIHCIADKDGNPIENPKDKCEYYEAKQ